MLNARSIRRAGAVLFGATVKRTVAELEDVLKPEVALCGVIHAGKLVTLQLHPLLEKLRLSEPPPPVGSRNALAVGGGGKKTLTVFPLADTDTNVHRD